MQSVGLPGLKLDPLLILFILLPGLVFTKCFIYGTKQADTLDRWDKIGFVLAGCVLSSVLVLSIYQYGLGKEALSTGDLSRFPMLTLLMALSGQSVTAGFIGFLVGEAYRCTDDQTYRTLRDREDPWEYTVSEIRDEFVHVETQDDEEIAGLVARYESGDGDDDILISRVAPESEQRLPNDESSNAVFLSGESITKIHFRDDGEHATEIDWPEGDSDFDKDELTQLAERENRIEQEEQELAENDD